MLPLTEVQFMCLTVHYLHPKHTHKIEYNSRHYRLQLKYVGEKCRYNE
jgi:hypothetical protein